MFHSKCDDIPNTLVIIKSAGNRRFGAFTIKEWSSTYNESYAFDKNAFLFSLDKQKIYPYIGDLENSQKNKYAIRMNKNHGPAFGIDDIYIYVLIAFKGENYHIHMNQIKIHAMIFIKIIMLYLRMEKKNVFILLNMKYFK